MMRETARTDASEVTRAGYRIAGAALVGGAVGTLALNALFPRPEDPADVISVLTTMAEHPVRQKVSFIGGAIALWVLIGGIAGVRHLLTEQLGPTWANLGYAMVLIGGSLFTASSALGLAVAHAAAEWAAAGSDPIGAEYAIAAALSAADDAVWAISIVALWSGLGLIGIALLTSDRVPRSLSVPIVPLGFGTAIVGGIPMAYAGVSQAGVVAFAVLALLTSAWALATGAWMLRRAPGAARAMRTPGAATGAPE